jgi:Zn-dependent protease
MDLTPDTLLLAASWFVAFLFSTTVHEAAHALAAMRLGDETAYGGGQVSLNPVPHIRREPLGMVVVPLLSFFVNGWMFGWASAPYDARWAHRYPRRAALMALAGPAANLLIFAVALLLLRAGLAAGLFEAPERLSFAALVGTPGGAASEGFATLLSVLFSLNLILCVFNLLPLPPMDGSAVIQLFLPESTARSLQAMLRQPMIGWMGILIAWQFFGRIFAPIHAVALSLLYPDLVYR